MGAFHGHGPDIHELAHHEKAGLMKAASYASVGVALSLVVVKAVAFVMTGSVAMLSSLVDSILDGGASLLNLLAVRTATEPADAEHRFGHGKAEALAGLGQAAFIGGSGVFVIFEAVSRILAPQPLEATEVGIWVSLFAIVLTIGLVLFQRYVVAKTQSLAISADALHYAMDLGTNVAVIGALVLSNMFDAPWIDGAIAVVIALVILNGAREIIVASYDVLMDRSLPEEDHKRIEEVVLSVDGVYGLHDLRTRNAGLQSFIQLHVDMDGKISLLEAHGIADKVERALRRAFPSAEVIVHQDPMQLHEKRPYFAGDTAEVAVIDVKNIPAKPSPSAEPATPTSPEKTEANHGH